MDEETIIKLLSIVIKKHLGQIQPDCDDEKMEEIASRLADSSWNALVLFFRQSVLEKRVVNLNELGRFDFSGQEWSFYPAASLIEAVFYKLPKDEGLRAEGYSVLFYLAEAGKLLETIPKDLVIHQFNQGEHLILSVKQTQLTTAIREHLYSLESQIMALEESSDRSVKYKPQTIRRAAQESPETWEDVVAKGRQFVVEAGQIVKEAAEKGQEFGGKTDE